MEEGASVHFDRSIGHSRHLCRDRLLSPAFHSALAVFDEIATS
jgi:hypothetical protein